MWQVEAIARLVVELAPAGFCDMMGVFHVKHPFLYLEDSMKVYLKKDVKGVGKAHQVVTVADGYARNYLLPRGLAVPATEGQIRAAREYAQSQQRREARERERAQRLAAELAEKELVFKVKAGEKGRLYGSITSADIAEKLGRVISVKFDKRNVLLEHPIREVGEHIVDLKLGGGVRASVKVLVEAEGN